MRKEGLEVGVPEGQGQSSMADFMSSHYMPGTALALHAQQFSEHSQPPKSQLHLLSLLY